MTSNRQRWLAALALAASASAGLAAHDFWIEPSSFEAQVGQAIGIRLRVGERFAGDPVARNDARLERFVLAGPSGERPVNGRDGVDPAGVLRLDAPGIWFVGYRSTPSIVELAAPAFQQYLREEGLERIIEERAKRGEGSRPGRERFSRSVKSLLRTPGSLGASGYDRRLGMTLEFVLEADPAAVSGGTLPVRLLLDGTPLEGALVVAYRKTEPGAGARETERGRTGADGRIRLSAGPGTWLVKAVHMQRAPGGAGVDWESVWTSLTFQIP